MLDLPTTWDVIVIGGGPAGSSAAFHLAQYGWKTLLLEKEYTPGFRKACGGGAMIGLKKILSLPQTICEKELCGTVFSIREKKRVWTSPEPIYLSFRRRDFDLFLAKRAAGAGARLLCGAEVIGSGYGSVTVRMRKDGRELLLRAKIIIYADGILSRAWKDRGIGFSPSSPFTKTLVYELKAPGNRVDAFHYYLRPDKFPFGCFWIFPKKDLLNVGVGKLKDSPGGSITSLLDRFCKENSMTAGKEIVTRRAGLLPNRRASVISDNACLVIGDAGGLIDPVTGGGILNALTSGVLAARACSYALGQKRYDAATLARFTREWRRTPEGIWNTFWGIVFRPLPMFTNHVWREGFARALKLNITLSLWLSGRQNTP